MIVCVADVGSPVPAEVRKPLTRTISCPSLAPLYAEPDVPAAVADRADKDKEAWPAVDTALDKEKSKTRCD